MNNSITEQQAKVDDLAGKRDAVRRDEERAKERGDLHGMHAARRQKKYLNNALVAAKARLRHLTKTTARGV